MKYKNRIAALLMCMLLCVLSVTAYAHDVPDKNRHGTVTVEMKYDGKTVKDGILTAYRVGLVQEYDGNYSFVKTTTMEGFSGSYDNINDSKLAEDVADFVKTHNIPAYSTAENSDGKAVFTDLELGLYLIVQTKASNGYEPLNPFLISVPMNEGGRYVYEVNAEGKFQLHQKPEPTTPTEPLEPKPTTPTKPLETILPQTGQLNWPIPVLVMLGLFLFAVGWLQRTGNE